MSEFAISVHGIIETCPSCGHTYVSQNGNPVPQPTIGTIQIVNDLLPVIWNTSQPVPAINAFAPISGCPDCPTPQGNTFVLSEKGVHVKGCKHLESAQPLQEDTK